MNNIIEELEKKISDKSMENVNTLVLVKLLLKSYDSSIYLDEEEIRNKIDTTLENFYSN